MAKVVAIIGDPREKVHQGIYFRSICHFFKNTQQSK